MKKIFIFFILTFAILLGGCAEKRATDDFEKKMDKAVAEQNAKLKKESEAANYEKLNDDKLAKGAQVYAIGEADSLHDEDFQTFILNTSGGVYSIENHSDTRVSDGEEVKVYRTYEGKSRLELPLIQVEVIEQ